MRRWCTVALALLVVTPASAVELTQDDRDLLGRIENYLNRVTTFDARFVQFSEGRLSQGRIQLARPGRMRIEYDPPVPVFVVAKGDWLMYHDRNLLQTSFIPADRTPLSFLLHDEISLEHSADIVGFEHEAGAIRVTLVLRDQPDAGQLTIVLESDPLRLVKWHVVDAQGTQVEVALLDPQFGVELDDDLFSLVDPALNQRD